MKEEANSTVEAMLSQERNEQIIVTAIGIPKWLIVRGGVFRRQALAEAEAESDKHVVYRSTHGVNSAQYRRNEYGNDRIEILNLLKVS